MNKLTPMSVHGAPTVEKRARPLNALFVTARTSSMKGTGRPPGFAQAEMRHMPCHIKRGLPTVMTIKPGCTFWGQRFGEEACNDATVFLGITHKAPKDADGRQRRHEAMHDHRNVRQYLDACRAGDGTQSWPKRPCRVDDGAPHDRNMYTNGALKMSCDRDLAVGGCGIWIPNMQGLDDHEVATGFVYKQAWEGGSAYWSPLLGTWQAAARAELAALMLASTCQIPIHIGIDNKAVVDKAQQLIEIARGWKATHGADASLPKRPLRKLFGTQADGDIWKEWWHILEARGPYSVWASKVKCHATTQMVDNGMVSLPDKDGNDNADRAANSGVNAHVKGLLTFTHKIKRRQADYAECIL